MSALKTSLDDDIGFRVSLLSRRFHVIVGAKLNVIKMNIKYEVNCEMKISQTAS